MIKNFKNWLNEGYLDSSEDQKSFIERHEDIVNSFEEKLKKSGIIDEKFWSNIEALDKKVQFNNELDEFIEKHYEKLYIGNYNHDIDNHEYTQEYHTIYGMARVEAEKAFPSVIQLFGPSGSMAMPGKKINFHRKRKAFIEKKLYTYLINKYWNEYKALYKKWTNYVIKNKPVILSKKFGFDR